VEVWRWLRTRPLGGSAVLRDRRTQSICHAAPHGARAFGPRSTRAKPLRVDSPRRRDAACHSIRQDGLQHSARRANARSWRMALTALATAP